MEDNSKTTTNKEELKEQTGAVNEEQTGAVNEEQTGAVNEEQQDKKPITVEDIKTANDAYSILIQAAESGRAKGIFSFDELEIISKSIKMAQSDINNRVFRTNMTGNIFLLPEETTEGEKNEATKSDFGQLTEGLPEDKLTRIGFEAVKMDKGFVCFANNEQFTGQKGDYLVKISDKFFLPIKALADEATEATQAEEVKQ